MFLTPTELAELTARKRPSAQVRWLSQAGMRYAHNALAERITKELRQ